MKRNIFLIAFIATFCNGLATAARQHLRSDVVYNERNVKEGRYKYGYAVKEGETQFHHQRSLDGAMYGCYGYVDPLGKLFITHYLADKGGYRLVNLANADKKQLDKIKTLGSAEHPLQLQSLFPLECQADGDIKVLQETAAKMKNSLPDRMTYGDIRNQRPSDSFVSSTTPSSKSEVEEKSIKQTPVVPLKPVAVGKNQEENLNNQVQTRESLPLKEKATETANSLNIVDRNSRNDSDSNQPKDFAENKTVPRSQSSFGRWSNNVHRGSDGSAYIPVVVVDTNDRPLSRLIPLRGAGAVRYSISALRKDSEAMKAPSVGFENRETVKAVAVEDSIKESPSVAILPKNSEPHGKNDSNAITQEENEPTVLNVDDSSGKSSIENKNEPSVSTVNSHDGLSTIEGFQMNKVSESVEAEEVGTRADQTINDNATLMGKRVEIVSEVPAVLRSNETSEDNAKENKVSTVVDQITSSEELNGLRINKISDDNEDNKESILHNFEVEAGLQLNTKTQDKAEENVVSKYADQNAKENAFSNEELAKIDPGVTTVSDGIGTVPMMMGTAIEDAKLIIPQIHNYQTQLDALDQIFEKVLLVTEKATVDDKNIQVAPDSSDTKVESKYTVNNQEDNIVDHGDAVGEVPTIASEISIIPNHQRTSNNSDAAESVNSASDRFGIKELIKEPIADDLPSADLKSTSLNNEPTLKSTDLLIGDAIQTPIFQTQLLGSRFRGNVKYMDYATKGTGDHKTGVTKKPGYTVPMQHTSLKLFNSGTVQNDVTSSNQLKIIKSAAEAEHSSQQTASSESINKKDSSTHNGIAAPKLDTQKKSFDEAIKSPSFSNHYAMISDTDYSDLINIVTPSIQGDQALAVDNPSIIDPVNKKENEEDPTQHLTINLLNDAIFGSDEIPNVLRYGEITTQSDIDERLSFQSVPVTPVPEPTLGTNRDELLSSIFQNTGYELEDDKSDTPKLLHQDTVSQEVETFANQPEINDEITDAVNEPNLTPIHDFGENTSFDNEFENSNLDNLTETSHESDFSNASQVQNLHPIDISIQSRSDSSKLTQISALGSKEYAGRNMPDTATNFLGYNASFDDSYAAVELPQGNNAVNVSDDPFVVSTGNDSQHMDEPKLPATPRTTTEGTVETVTVSYSFSNAGKPPVFPRPTTSHRPNASNVYLQATTTTTTESSRTSIGPNGDIYDEIEEDLDPPKPASSPRPIQMSPQTPSKPSSNDSGYSIQPSISSNCYEVILQIPIDAKQVLLKTDSTTFRVYGDGEPANRIRQVKPGVYEVNIGATSGIKFQQYQHKDANKLTLDIAKGFNYGDLVQTPASREATDLSDPSLNNPYLPMVSIEPAQDAGSAEVMTVGADSHELTQEQRALLSLVPSWKKVLFYY
ncbi:uncharacterized protein LOC134220826 [Armigeres subalbatus]|uniref:uncharacterized protein LOC134220826 n=1 Tax=Armigeres subalbatus TaxID=124917 RepID=UPI002ED0F035